MSECLTNIFGLNHMENALICYINNLENYVVTRGTIVDLRCVKMYVSKRLIVIHSLYHACMYVRSHWIFIVHTRMSIGDRITVPKCISMYIYFASFFCQCQEFPDKIVSFSCDKNCSLLKCHIFDWFFVHSFFHRITICTRH